jgi:hypothetical protein
MPQIATFLCKTELLMKLSSLDPKPCPRTYFVLLVPTPNHFCPHLNRTTFLVKRIRAFGRFFLKMCD